EPSSEEERVWHQIISIQTMIIKSGIEAFDSCVTVDYKNLCDDPRGEIGRIFKWLRIDNADKYLSRLPTRLENKNSEESLSVESILALNEAMEKTQLWPNDGTIE